MATLKHDIIAQAYDLARSGMFSSLAEIRQELERTGYSDVVQHFSGPTIRKQLNDLIKQHRQK